MCYALFHKKLKVLNGFVLYSFRSCNDELGLTRDSAKCFSLGEGAMVFEVTVVCG